MKVLVTGGAGFLGSHFLNHVVPRYPEYSFVCVDKLGYASRYCTDLIRVSHLINYKFIQGDLTSLSFVQELFQEHFDYIINFAAESCVDRLFEDPLLFTCNNILATQHLLEQCRKTTIGLLHVSTDEVYGEQGDSTESSALDPTNPYSASKAAVDLIIRSYIYSYNIKATIIRPNNVIGSGQYPEKIVPVTLDVLQRRSKGENVKIPVHGSGSNKRTYLHVQDFIRAVELIWKKQQEDKTYGEIYNVGAAETNELTNIALVRFLCEEYYTRFNIKGDWQEAVHFVADRCYNDARYSLDCLKIMLLGWEPTIGVYEGLRQIVGELSKDAD